MSSRPRRSCTLPIPTPILSQILEDVYDSTDTEIYQQFKQVSKYYKDDLDEFATFWLSDTTEYDLGNREHLQLLTRILNTVNLKHLLVLEFLNTLTKKQVRSVGLQRVITLSSTFYRSRVGMDAASKDPHDYDDYCKAWEYGMEHCAN